MTHLKVSAFQFKHIPVSSERRALLLLVHGRTGNLRLLEWYSKRFQIEGLDFITIQAPYPDTRPDQKEPGWSWYLHRDQKYEGLEDVRIQLNQMIEELCQQGLESKQIYWLGFSQGGTMGLDLALRGNYQLGGVMGISCFCLQVDEYPEKFGPHAKSQRILLTHGSRDEIVPLEPARDGYQKLKDLGVPLEFVVYDKPHSFHLQKEIPHLEETLKGWINSQ